MVLVNHDGQSCLLVLSISVRRLRRSARFPSARRGVRLISGQDAVF